MLPDYNYFQALAELLELIRLNFWQIFTILLLMRFKSISAVFLVGMHLLFGYHWWIYGIGILYGLVDTALIQSKELSNKEIDKFIQFMKK